MYEKVTGPMGVPGIEMVLADMNTYVLAPLTFGPAKRLLAMANAKQASALIMDELAKSLLWSLKRNYPDMTIERVEDELLGFGNKDEVQLALLNATGFLSKQGEAVGASQAPPSTGMNSTLG